VQQYHEAVRYVPEFVEAYQAMAASYEALGRPAEEEYARGMEAFSGRAYAQAEQSLLRAAADLPDFAPLYLGLGLTYEQLGETGMARENLERTLSLDPDNFYAAVVIDRLLAAESNQ
jgi:tetratricopeptide (TPR) repeat protein